MKMNKNIICIIALILAIVLGAFMFVFNFARSADARYSAISTINLNDEFDVKDVEKAFKDAGADTVIVQSEQVYNSAFKKYENGTNVVVNFTIKDGADIQEVCDKANDNLGEQFFLKYEAKNNAVTAVVNKNYMVKLWPVLVVLALVAVYAFIRFGAKIGIASIVLPALEIIYVAGTMAVAKVWVSTFTAGAFMFVTALGVIGVLVYGYGLKATSKKTSAEEAYKICTAKLFKTETVVSVVAAAALCMALILGSDLLKNCALTALIGVVYNCLLTVFVLPAFLKK